MENIMMRYCREKHRYSYSRIAKHLGISDIEYKELEIGKQLITPEQADQLGELFNVKGDYFYQAAMQLEGLLSKSDFIRVLQEELKRFKEDLPAAKRPKKRTKRV
jgi:transcriptional regulator with XRE-family HTH domain